MHSVPNCFYFPKNLATSTTTPTTPGIITTYPPPELLYAKTTDYHWPNFEQKMDDRTGKYLAEDGGLSDGPFGFGKSVKLKVGVEGERDEVCTLNIEYILHLRFFSYMRHEAKRCPFFN